MNRIPRATASHPSQGELTWRSGFTSRNLAFLPPASSARSSCRARTWRRVVRRSPWCWAIFRTGYASCSQTRRGPPSQSLDARDRQPDARGHPDRGRPVSFAQWLPVPAQLLRSVEGRSSNRGAIRQQLAVLLLPVLRPVGERHRTLSGQQAGLALRPRIRHVGHLPDRAHQPSAVLDSRPARHVRSPERLRQPQLRVRDLPA